MAILATMRIKDQVRAENREAQALKTFSLCLCFNYHVVSGAEAARFMSELIAKPEDPDFLIKQK